MTGPNDTAPDRDEDAALAAEYALGLLGADEARAFESRLAREPALRALHAEWADRFAALGDAPGTSPPEHLQTAIEARLFGPARRPATWPLASWRLWAGAALIAAFALALFVATRPAPVPGFDPGFVAEITGEDSALRMVATIDAEAGELRVTRLSGGPPEGRVLELWLIAAEAAPVSLGVLPDAADAPVILGPAPAAALATPGAVLAVSEEPPGGSPTGQPTGAVLGLGPVTTL